MNITKSCSGFEKYLIRKVYRASLLLTKKKKRILLNPSN